MEGQKQLIKLAPYFASERVPGGFYARRLTRHGFLGNRWSLQHRTSQFPSIITGNHTDMLRGAVLNTVTLREPGAEFMPITEVQSTPGHKLEALQRELHILGDSMQRLERTVVDISKQFAQGSEKLLERLTEPTTTEGIKQVECARKSSFEGDQQIIKSLKRERELDKKRLNELEKDIELANVRAQMATRSLAEAQRAEGAQPKQPNATEKQEDADINIQAAFLSLRDSILDLAGSSAIQLGQLPDTVAPLADRLFHPRVWNRASLHQRKRRVMAKIFQLLFRRILRSGLRAFGVQAFLRCNEHHSISTSEARLRALERELEANGVEIDALNGWIATTISITAPLRDITQNVEGVSQEIMEALSPVLRFTFTRNVSKVKAEVSAICERAVELKLAMRQARGGHMIEVPSRDVKKWGEPGCDQETRQLEPMVWLQVIDREVKPSDEEKGGLATGEETTADVACIPFGALTKYESGPNGERRKVVLEKGWVVTKADSGKVKRKAPTQAVGDEQLQKRVAANRGVLSPQLARLRALMGQE